MQLQLFGTSVLRVYSIRKKRNRFTSSTSCDRLITIASRPPEPRSGVPDSKSVFPCFSKITLSARCNETRNWITTGVNDILGWTTMHEGPIWDRFVSAFGAFCRKLASYFSKRAVHRISYDTLSLQTNPSAENNKRLEVRLLFRSGRHAHCLGQLQFPSTIVVVDEPRELLTNKQRR